MLTYLLPVFSASACAGIEWYRIHRLKGTADNVNKFWTINFAIYFFALCLMGSVNYYDEVGFFDVIWYGIYYIGIRGTIYDPLLNAFRGLRFDYFSTYTNSKIDRLAANYGAFYALRAISVLTAAIFGYLWHLRY